MKIMKYIAVPLMAVFAAAGCSDLDKVRVSDSTTPPVLDSHDPIVVTEENVESDEVIRFTWTRADYGFEDAAEYILYGSYNGITQRISSAYGSYLEISVTDFNAAMLTLELPTDGSSADVTMYLETHLSSTYGIVESNRITVAVTAFKAEDYIYIPGNYQGWDPPSAPRLYPISLRSSYQGCANIVPTDPNEEPEFKFTHGPSWDRNWGGTFPNLVFDGANCTLPAGFYLFKFLFTNYDADEVNVSYIGISQIGMIGDALTATGWDNEATMTQDAADPYLFTLTGLQMNAGEYKFRFNNDWTDSLGGTPDNLTLEGGNVAYDEAGIFDVTLNMGVYPYQVTLVKQ